MSDVYYFRREDNDEIIEVDFQTAMSADAAGFITLPDGVVARRARSMEPRMESASSGTPELAKPMVSDALGFTAEQFHEFEEDRRRHGFTAIEFVRDPHCETFMQVKCSSPAEYQRYREHRNDMSKSARNKYRGEFNDRNSRNGGGQPLSKRDLEAAAARVRELYPV